MSHGEMPDNDAYKRASSEGDEKVNWKKLKVERKESKKRIKESKVIHQLQKQQQQADEAAAEEAKGAALQTKGRQYTVTVALPGSVMDNAQSTELRTYLAGQIARACVVFNVDEIVVFDEYGEDVRSVEGEFTGVKKKGQACIQLARILQFLECPQYLRKSFFPKHQDLQYAGLLNPLDSPHHMRVDEESEYREGVVLDRPTRPGKGSFVNCGMWKEVQIDKQLQPGLRVTVHLNKNQKNESRKYKGVVVAPHVPRSQGGLYWGYSVRLASALSTVFTECPYKEGYDLTIGTSEKGCSIDQASIKPFKHLLVVFGGLQGLEASLDTDQNLEVTDPSLLFDLYLNTCPSQGSRTIRTEEAILISMAGLRQKINSAFTTGS